MSPSSGQSVYSHTYPHMHQHPLQQQQQPDIPLPLFGALRRSLFPQIKEQHFWKALARSVGKASKAEDDYDYPDDLPQVRLNRFRAFRGREAGEILDVSGDDLLQSSLFCQLWLELRKHPESAQRVCYTHPMDDGQSRAFKVKFDGEGVDDYGGPYREIFQQICDELQAARPRRGQGQTSSTAGDGGGGVNDTDDSPQCFLPLLLPTPNWSSAAGECDEKYKYMFAPSADSALRMDLYRFMGQLVGMAVRSHITLNLELPSLVWKSVVRQRLTEKDLASVDAGAAAFVEHLSGLYRKYLLFHRLLGGALGTLTERPVHTHEQQQQQQQQSSAVSAAATASLEERGYRGVAAPQTVFHFDAAQSTLPGLAANGVVDGALLAAARADWDPYLTGGVADLEIDPEISFSPLL